MTDPIKPCPFCGAQTEDSAQRGERIVYHDIPCFLRDSYMTEKHATQYNTRPIEDELLDALADALRQSCGTPTGQVDNQCLSTWEDSCKLLEKHGRLKKVNDRIYVDKPRKPQRPRPPRTWWLPLTYKPKIPGVLNGTIRQTIRPGNKFIVGDRVGYHGWAGRPYWSAWTDRCGPWPAIEVIPLLADSKAVWWVETGDDSRFTVWTGLDDIAALDGIDPPTGIALRDVLTAYHGPLTGQPFQIIRWETALSPVPTPTRREPPHPQRQQT